MENAEEMKAFVESGNAVMGIELGSTRPYEDHPNFWLRIASKE